MQAVPVAVISRPWAALKARTSPAARRFRFARKRARQAATVPQLAAPAWVYLRGPFNFASSTALRGRLRKGGPR
jgi:nicotinate-nucleotide adenylyltransferase